MKKEILPGSNSESGAGLFEPDAIEVEDDGWMDI